jgi:hypothetical protein
MKRLTVLFALVPLVALAATVESQRDATEAERATIEEGVKRGLRDPASAEFRQIKIGPDKEGVLMACGEVNSKNAFGGYVGFSKFMAMLVVREEKVAAALLIGIDSRYPVAAEQCAKIGL